MRGRRRAAASFAVRGRHSGTLLCTCPLNNFQICTSTSLMASTRILRWKSTRRRPPRVHSGRARSAAARPVGADHGARRGGPRDDPVGHRVRPHAGHSRGAARAERGSQAARVRRSSKRAPRTQLSQELTVALFFLPLALQPAHQLRRDEQYPAAIARRLYLPREVWNPGLVGRGPLVCA